MSSALPEERKDIGPKIVLPEAMVQDVLSDLHSGLMGAHVRRDKMLSLVLSRFWRPGLASQTRTFVDQCQICQRRLGKPDKHAPLVPMISMKRGNFVSTDICGPYSVTSSGNTTIHSFVEHYSRAVRLVPEPDSTTKSASHALTEGMIREWGVPANLLTDNGKCYTSEEFRVLCRLLRIRKLYTTTYHPSGNGQEERVHRFLNDAMAKLQLEFPGDWDRKLWVIELVYNATVNPSTGFSPFFVLHGFEPVLPVDLQFGVVKDRIPTGIIQDMVEAVGQRAHTQSVTKELIGDWAFAAAGAQASGYNSKRLPSPFVPGVLVSRFQDVSSVSLPKKWWSLWSLPVRVAEVLGPNLVRLAGPDGVVDPKPVSTSKLKLWVPSPNGPEGHQALPSSSAVP